MGYSAQIPAEYKKHVRRWGADISLKQYFHLYWQPALYAILDDRERPYYEHHSRHRGAHGIHSRH